MNYDWRTTAKKAAINGIAVLAISTVAVWGYLQASGFSGTVSEIVHNRVLLVALIAIVYRALDNWRKKSGVDGKPRFEWPWGNFLPFCLLVCLSLAFAGCATQTIKRTEIHPDGTTYKDEITTTDLHPVGGKDEAIFQVEKTGLNNVKVGQTSNSDTTAMSTLLAKIVDLMSGLVGKAP